MSIGWTGCGGCGFAFRGALPRTGGAVCARSSGRCWLRVLEPTNLPLCCPAQEYQTWLDLRELEGKMGERYITHESDDARWEQFVAEHPLPGRGLPTDGELGGTHPSQDHDMQGLAERISVL